MSFLQKIMGKNTKKNKSKGKKMAPAEKGLKDAAALASSLAVPSAVSPTPQVVAQPSSPPKKPEAQASGAAVAPPTNLAPSPKLKGKKSHAQASASTSQQANDNMSSQSSKEPPNQAVTSSLVQDGSTVKHEVESQRTVLLNTPTIISESSRSTITEIPKKSSDLNKREVTLPAEVSASRTSTSHSEGEKGAKCPSKDVPVETRNKQGRVSKPTQPLKDLQQGKEEKPKHVQVADKPKALLTTESRELPKPSTNAAQKAALIRLDTKNVEVAHVTESSAHVSGWLHDKLVLETLIAATSLEAATSSPSQGKTLKTQAAQDESSREVSVVSVSKGIEHKELPNVSYPKEAITPQNSGSGYGMNKAGTHIETAGDRNSSSLGPVIVQTKMEESEQLDMSKQSNPGSATTSKRVSETLWAILENFEQQINQDKTSKKTLVPISKQKEKVEDDHKVMRDQTECVDSASAPITTIGLTPEVDEVRAVKTEKHSQEPLETAAGIEQHEHKNKAYQVSIDPSAEANRSDTHDVLMNKGNKTQLMGRGEATPLYTNQTTTPSNSAKAQEKASSFEEIAHKNLNDDGEPEVGIPAVDPQQDYHHKNSNDDREPEVGIPAVDPQQDYHHTNLLQPPEDHNIQETLSRELDEQRSILQEPKFANVVVNSNHEYLQEEQKLNSLRESLEKEPQKDIDEGLAGGKTIEQANFTEELKSENNTTVADQTTNESLKSEQKVICNDLAENELCQLQKELEKATPTEATDDKTKKENVVSEQEVCPNDIDEIISKTPRQIERALENVIPTEATHIIQEQTSTIVLEQKDELQAILHTNVCPLRDNESQELHTTKSLEVGLQDPGKVTMLLSPDKDKPLITEASTIAEEEHMPLDVKSYRKELAVIDDTIGLQEVELQQVQEQVSAQNLKQEELLHTYLPSDSVCQNPEIKSMSTEEGLHVGIHQGLEKPSNIKEKPEDDHNHENSTTPATLELEISEAHASDKSLCEGNTTLSPDQIMQKQECDTHYPQHSVTQDSMSITGDKHTAKDALETYVEVTNPQHQDNEAPHLGIMDVLVQEGVSQAPQAADLEPTPWSPMLHSEQGQEPIHEEQTSRAVDEQNLELEELNNNKRETVVDVGRNNGQQLHLPTKQTETTIGGGQEMMPLGTAAIVDKDHHCAHEEHEKNFPSLDATERKYEVQDADFRKSSIEQTSQKIQFEDLAGSLTREVSVPQVDDKKPEQAKEENSLEKESTQEPQHNNYLQDVPCKQEQSLMFTDEDPVDANFHEIEQEIKQGPEDRKLEQEPLTCQFKQRTLPLGNMEDEVADTTVNFSETEPIDMMTEIESASKQKDNVNENPQTEIKMFSDFDSTEPVQTVDTHMTISTNAVSTSIDVMIQENQEYPKIDNGQVSPSTETSEQVLRDMDKQKNEVATLPMQTPQVDEMQGGEVAHISQDTEQEVLNEEEEKLCAQNRIPSGDDKEPPTDVDEQTLAVKELDKSEDTEIDPANTGESEEVQPCIENLACESFQLTKSDVIAADPERSGSTEVAITEQMHASLYVVEDDLQKPELTRVALDKKQGDHGDEFEQDHTDSIVQEPAITDVSIQVRKDPELEVTNTQHLEDAGQEMEATCLSTLKGLHDEEAKELQKSEIQKALLNPKVESELEVNLIHSMDKQEQNTHGLNEIAIPRTDQVQYMGHNIDQSETGLPTVQHTDTSCITEETQAGLDVDECRSEEQKPQMADGGTEKEPTSDRTNLTEAPEEVGIRKEVSFETDEPGVAEVQSGAVNECKFQELNIQTTDAEVEKQPESDRIQTTQASRDTDIREEVLSNIHEQWEAIVDPGLADDQIGEVNACKYSQKGLQTPNTATEKDIDTEDNVSFRSEHREAIREPQLAEVQIEDVNECKPKEQALQITDTGVEKEPENDTTEIAPAPKDITIREEASFETDEQREAICAPEISEIQTVGVDEHESEEEELQTTDAAAEKEPTSNKIETTEAPEDIDIREEVPCKIDKQWQAVCEPGYVKEYKSEEQVLQTQDATVEKKATSDKTQKTEAPEDTIIKEEVFFEVDEQREALCEPDVAEVQIADLSMNQLHIEMDASKQPEEPRAEQQLDDGLEYGQNTSALDNKLVAQTSKQEVEIEVLHETDAQDEPDAKRQECNQLIGSDNQDQELSKLDEQTNHIQKFEGTILHLEEEGQNFEDKQKNEVHGQETEQESPAYDLEQIESSTPSTQPSPVKDEESKIAKLKNDVAIVTIATESSPLVTEISSCLGKITFGKEKDIPADLEIEEQPSPYVEEYNEKVKEQEVFPVVDTEKNICDERNSIPVLPKSKVEEQVSIDDVDQNNHVHEVEVTDGFIPLVAEGQKLNSEVEEQASMDAVDQNNNVQEVEADSLSPLVTEKEQVSDLVELEIQKNELEEVQPTNAQVEYSQTNNGDKQTNADHDVEADSICTSSLLVEGSDHKKHAQALVCTEEIHTSQSVGERNAQVHEPGLINEAIMESKTLDGDVETETEVQQSVRHPQCKQSTSAVNEEFYSIEKENEEMQAGHASQDEAECEALDIQQEGEPAYRAFNILWSDSVPLKMTEESAKENVCVKAMDAANDIEEYQDEANKTDQTDRIVASTQEGQGKEPNQVNTGPIINEQSTNKIEQESHMQEAEEISQQQEELQRRDEMISFTHEEEQKNEMQESKELTFEQEQGTDFVNSTAPIPDGQNPMIVDDQKIESGKLVSNEVDEQRDPIKEVEQNKKQTETPHDSSFNEEKVFHDLEATPPTADHSVQTESVIVAEDVHMCNQPAQETYHGSAEILMETDNIALVKEPSCAQEAPTSQELGNNNLASEQKQNNGTERISTESFLGEHEFQRLEATKESVGAEIEKGEKQEREIAPDLWRLQQEVQKCEEGDVNEQEAEIQHLDVNTDQAKRITDFSQIQDVPTYERSINLREAMTPPENSDKTQVDLQEPNEKQETTEQNQERDELPSNGVFTADMQVTTLNEERDGVQESEITVATFDEVFPVDRQLTIPNGERVGMQEKEITAAPIETDKDQLNDATQKPNDKEEAADQNQQGDGVAPDEVLTEHNFEEQVVTLKEERDGTQEREITGATLKADKDEFNDATQEPDDKEQEIEQKQKIGEVPSDDVFMESKVEDQVATQKEEGDYTTQENEIRGAPVEADKDEIKNFTHKPEETIEQNPERDEVPSDEVFTEPKVEGQFTSLHEETDGTQESEIIGVPLEADKDKFKDATHEPHDKEETIEQNQERDGVQPDEIFIEPKAEGQVNILHEETDNTQESETTGAPLDASKIRFKDETEEPNDKEETIEQNEERDELLSDEVFTKPKAEEQAAILLQKSHGTQESEITGAPLEEDKGGLKDATHEPTDETEAIEQNHERDEMPPEVFTELKVEEQVAILNEHRNGTQEIEIAGAPLEADKGGFKDATQEPCGREEVIEQNQKRDEMSYDRVFKEPQVEEQFRTLNEERDGTQENETTRTPLEADKDGYKGTTMEPNDNDEVTEQNQERNDVPSDKVFTEHEVEERITTLNKEEDGSKETKITGCEEVDVNEQEETVQHIEVNPKQAETITTDEATSDILPNEAERGRVLVKTLISLEEEHLSSDRDGHKDAAQEPNDNEEGTKQNQAEDEVQSDDIFEGPKTEEQVLSLNDERDTMQETGKTKAPFDVNKEIQEQNLSVAEAEHTTETEKTGETCTDSPQLSGNQEDNKISTGNTYILRPLVENCNSDKKEEAPQAVINTVEEREENHEEKFKEDPIAPELEEQTIVQMTEGIKVVDVSIAAEGHASFESQLKAHPSDSGSDPIATADENCLSKDAEECKHSTLEEHTGRQQEENFDSSSLPEDGSSTNSIKAQTVVGQESAGLTCTDRQLESDAGEPQAKGIALEKETEEKCDQIHEGHVHEDDSSIAVGKHQNGIEGLEVQSEVLNVETQMEDIHILEAANIPLEKTNDTIKLEAPESDEEGTETDDQEELKGQEEKADSIEMDIGTDNIAKKDSTEQLEEKEETLKLEANSSIWADKDRDDTVKRVDIEELEGIEAANSIEVDQINRKVSEELAAEEENPKLETTRSIELDIEKDDTGEQNDKENLEEPEKTLQLEARGSIDVDIEQNETEEQDVTKEIQGAEEALKITLTEVHMERHDTAELKRPEKPLQLEANDSLKVELERYGISDCTEEHKGAEETLELKTTTEFTEVNIQRDNAEESDDMDELKQQEKTLQFEVADSIDVDIERDDTEKKSGTEEPEGAEETLKLEAINSINMDVERGGIQDLKVADEETEQNSATLGDGQEHSTYADEQNNDLQQIDMTSVPHGEMNAALELKVTDASLHAIEQSDELKDLDRNEEEPKKADIDLLSEEMVSAEIISQLEIEVPDTPLESDKQPNELRDLKGGNVEPEQIDPEAKCEQTHPMPSETETEQLQVTNQSLDITYGMPKLEVEDLIVEVPENKDAEQELIKTDERMDAKIEEHDCEEKQNMIVEEAAPTTEEEKYAHQELEKVTMTPESQEAVQTVEDYQIAAEKVQQVQLPDLHVVLSQESQGNEQDFITVKSQKNVQNEQNPGEQQDLELREAPLTMSHGELEQDSEQVFGHKCDFTCEQPITALEPEEVLAPSTQEKEHAADVQEETKELKGEARVTCRDGQSDELQNFSRTNIAPIELQKREPGLVDEGQEHADIGSTELYTKVPCPVDGTEAPLDLKDEEKDGKQGLAWRRNEHLDSTVLLTDEDMQNHQFQEPNHEKSERFTLPANEEQPHSDAQAEKADIKEIDKAEHQVSCLEQEDARVNCEDIAQAPHVSETMQQTAQNNIVEREDIYVNTPEVLHKQLAPSEDDNAQNMKVILEVLGEPNQKVLEATDDNESQTLLGIQGPIAEHKETVQTHNDADKDAEREIQISKETLAAFERTPNLEEPVLTTIEAFIGGSEEVHQEEHIQIPEVPDAGPEEQNVIKVDDVAKESPPSTCIDKQENEVEKLTVSSIQPENGSDKSHLDKSEYHSPDQMPRQADVEIPEQLPATASEDPTPLNVIKDEAEDLQQDCSKMECTQLSADNAMFPHRQKDAAYSIEQELEVVPAESSQDEQQSTDEADQQQKKVDEAFKSLQQAALSKACPTTQQFALSCSSREIEQRSGQDEAQETVSIDTTAQLDKQNYEKNFECVPTTCLYQKQLTAEGKMEF